MVRYGNIAGISLEEALNRINETFSPLKGEEAVKITEAAGFVASRDYVAKEPYPSFNRSAMDGYAVNSRDIKEAGVESAVALRVKGIVYAGDTSKLKYEEGTAVRIMTGAEVPEGYDCVVKQEDTDFGEDLVKVYVSLPPGMNVSPVGESYMSGDCLIKKGTRLKRTEIGILAGLGYEEVFVMKPLKVAVISTGSELLRPGESNAPGKIYNNVSAMLVSSIKAGGSIVVSDLMIADDVSEIIKAVTGCSKKADVVITTGGVSVGAKDHMHEALDEAGAGKLFYRTAIQPGTPTIFAVLNNTPVLCLSGNPYAALVNFDLFFRELASVLSGCPDFRLKREKAVITDAYDKKNILRRFIRGVAEGGRVRPEKSKNRSSVISDMTGCNCYIDVPKETSLAAGDTVDIILMKDM
ncbi:MAG: molybdopterin molybdotransferase MoeA [Lachnospiraceae bacterium]|nr:molybdopterin molybdotransferase MoeA [Lachnospiraceae bacterium]